MYMLLCSPKKSKNTYKYIPLSIYMYNKITATSKQQKKGRLLLNCSMGNKEKNPYPLQDPKEFEKGFIQKKKRTTKNCKFVYSIDEDVKCKFLA